LQRTAPEDINHLILLAAADEEDLLNIRLRLQIAGIEHTMFFEPDWDMGHTSITTRPMRGRERNFFKKFKMWKHL
jgi:hypothetical protein